MIKLYNTLTRKKEEFKPVEEGKVGIYVCGPTVYGMPHLGHAKSYTNFDTIVRYFTFCGYKVKYVQNITDVGHLVGDGDEGEDKIAKQAKKESLDAYEIAYKYEVEYFKNMDKLNILETIQDIINKGYGYVTPLGNVYFDVRKYSNYGQLSNRKLENNMSGERIEVATDKKNPEDFALWKATEKGALMQWNSPWGVGCPGWHIECTTLGKKFLGTHFDIHGGGIDNIFPHHECECAQADIVNGSLPMTYFMHNGLVTVNGQKMGKSLGNFITLPDLFSKYDPMVIRLFIQQFHYRSAVGFTDDELKVAEKQFEKLRTAVNAVRSKTKAISEIVDTELKDIYNRFIDAMNEDFNTPLAIVEFNKIIKIINTAIDSGNDKIYPQINKFICDLGEQVLGLVFGESSREESDDIPQEIKSLAESRWQAKQNKDCRKGL